MSEKATILGIKSNTYHANMNDWFLVLSVSITNGPNTEIFADITVPSNQFNGGNMGWKQKIKPVIVSRANLDYGITVDQVLFPDFTVI